MKITQIAFTGIPVTDMKRAREFYEGVLGLQADPEMTGEMWTEYPIGGGTLAIACIGEQWKPSDQGTSAALEVESLEDAIARLGRAQDSIRADRFAGLSDGRDPGPRRQQDCDS